MQSQLPYGTQFLQILRGLRSLGCQVDPVSTIPERLRARQSAIYIRHDVHNVRLPKLVEFATAEALEGFRASYFFMGKNHPRTRDSYSFTQQCEAIRQIKELGHDVGLHVDPFVGMSKSGTMNPFSLEEEVSEFAKFGVEFSLGTMHGSSLASARDLDGFSLGWEFFEELGREAGLERAPLVVAEKILESRARSADHGFRLWADLPTWFNHEFIAMNYVSDNSIAKVGGLNLEVFHETRTGYYVSKTQPRGSSRRSNFGTTVESLSGCSFGGLEPTTVGKKTLTIENHEQIVKILAVSQPLLFLSHPDFLIS